MAFVERKPSDNLNSQPSRYQPPQPAKPASPPASKDAFTSQGFLRAEELGRWAKSQKDAKFGRIPEKDREGWAKGWILPGKDYITAQDIPKIEKKLREDFSKAKTLAERNKIGDDLELFQKKFLGK